jgi:Fic family protein
MLANLKILTTSLFEEYERQLPANLQVDFERLKDAEISTSSFSFYTSVSSVFSSKIEGEEIELDSYIKHKKFGIEFLPDYTKKIDDLYNAYTFAKTNQLNQTNIEKSHSLLSKHILPLQHQGKLRKNNMYVSTPDGKIAYVAISPYELENELKLFYADVELLVKEKLSLYQVFYFAALIHLVFVKIHPWNDGNGRSARLLEKWFLGQHLGEKAWFVQSEKNYYQQHTIYYQNISKLGIEYPLLDYTKALPFLLMLPQSFDESVKY